MILEDKVVVSYGGQLLDIAYHMLSYRDYSRYLAVCFVGVRTTGMTTSGHWSVGSSVGIV